MVFFDFYKRFVYVLAMFSIYIYIDIGCDFSPIVLQMISNVFMFWFDSIMYWIRIIQRFYIRSIWWKWYVYVYMMFSKKPYMYKKGFSMDFIKMSLKMLGQKSINSCKEPFTSSTAKLWPRKLVCDLVSNMTSY